MRGHQGTVWLDLTLGDDHRVTGVCWSSGVRYDIDATIGEETDGRLLLLTDGSVAWAVPVYDDPLNPGLPVYPQARVTLYAAGALQTSEAFCIACERDPEPGELSPNYDGAPKSCDHCERLAQLLAQRTAVAAELRDDIQLHGGRHSAQLQARLDQLNADLETTTAELESIIAAQKARRDAARWRE